MEQELFLPLRGPSSHSSPRKLSMVPFPQSEKHLFTSCAQFWQVSPESMIPFPQRGRFCLIRRHEREHLLSFPFIVALSHSSFRFFSIFPFPQLLLGRSSGQFWWVSPASAIPFPQIEVQVPTSSGQETQVSPWSILPSQHFGVADSQASQIPLLLRSDWSLLWMKGQLSSAQTQKCC